MGTTLTGTTPQDTYDSLIKVTDNGPLSGSLKTLTDGLGNDSALALSTGAASITGTLAVSSGLTAATGSFLGSSANGTLRAEIAVESPASNNTALIAKTSNGGNDIFRWFDGATQLGVFKNSGNVGIGTSSPNAKLAIVASSGSTNAALINDTPTTAGTEVSYLSYFGTDNGGTMFATPLAQIGAISKNGGVAFGDLVFRTTPASGATAERVRILADGGLTFNGDTAAANALDDYEEGTWTPSLGGTATYAIQLGTYTKIGRQVVAKFAVSVTTLGTGSASSVSGLPFTSLVANRGGGGITYVLNPSTAYASINPFVNVGVTAVEFVTSTTSGVWADSSNVFTDGTFISGTVTYFV